MNIFILGGSGSLGIDLIRYLDTQFPLCSITATCSNPIHMSSLIPSVSWLSYVNVLLANSDYEFTETYDCFFIVSGSHTLRNQSGRDILKCHSIPLMSFLERLISSCSVQPKFVFVSSANGIRALDLRNNIIPQNLNLYGLEKLMLECFLLALSQESGSNIYIVRLNNVFDPAMTKPGFGVFNHFSRCISQGIAPHFTEDCYLPKDYVYIRDLTRFLASLISPGMNLPSVFELYGGLSITARDLYDSMYSYFHNGTHLSPSRVTPTRRDPSAVKVFPASLDIEAMIAKSFEFTA